MFCLEVIVALNNDPRPARELIRRSWPRDAVSSPADAVCVGTRLPQDSGHKLHAFGRRRDA